MQAFLFFPGALPQTAVIKRITWHKASSKLELLLCRWILLELYVDGCCSCRGTINSVVIIIDFPQVIIICHILDIRGFNAASQMAFWLIGTMLQGGSNTEAFLTRSVALLLCQEYRSLLFVRKFKYTAWGGSNSVCGDLGSCRLPVQVPIWTKYSVWTRALILSRSCNFSKFPRAWIASDSRLFPEMLYHFYFRAAMNSLKLYS